MIVREFSLWHGWLTLASLGMFVVAGLISIRRPARMRSGMVAGSQQ
jgi:hypothetical protein